MISRRGFLEASVLAAATGGTVSLRAADSTVSSPTLAETFGPAYRNTELSIQCALQARTDRRPAPISALDSHGVTDCWKELFAWPEADKYKFFLLDLPHPLSINELSSAQYQDMFANLAVVNWRPTGLQDRPNAFVTVRIPKTMHQYNSPLRSEQYCVELDGINATVPEVAAHVCSAGFAAGLACRLTLNDLLKDASSIPAFGVRNSQASKLQSGVVITRNNNETWDAFVARIMQAAPFEAAGIFHGWQAGGELSGLVLKDVTIRDAAWRLLKSRFSWDELGELCGYALNYIVGYLRCQAVLNSVTQARQPFNAANVVAAMRDDGNIKAIDDVLGAMFSGLLGQIFGVYNENRAAAQRFEQYLVGFQRGQQRASEVVFQQALSLGYGIGYRDGFQTGYARGYADGYRDGYNAGDSDFFSGVFHALHDVAQIVSGVAEIAGYFA